MDRRRPTRSANVSAPGSVQVNAIVVVVAKVVLAGGQVELHGVGVDAEQPGAGLRLVAGQVGSRHARHHVT